jgi:hypothetical protein
MKIKTIILIIILLAIGILIGYFVLPILFRPSTTGIGEGVFRAPPSNVSPPQMP